jgi:hypothetical protein
LMIGNNFVNLLDQTGQVVGDLAGKNIDHRTGTVASAIAERFALLRAGAILHEIVPGCVTRLQSGLQLCRCHDTNRHNEQRDARDCKSIHGHILQSFPGVKMGTAQIRPTVQQTLIVLTFPPEFKTAVF